MTQSPPLCLHQQKDIQAIQILREHGQESGCSYHSTTQAIDLASGLSDVIVILERPRTEISHSPNQSYADFVNGCHTLKAVDELLRFASRGTRDIGTVTVVNAFSLQPDKNALKADLSQFYLYRGKDVVPLSKGGFADESLSEQIARESETFDSLSFWLTLLLEKPQKFELFGLASARFLLQKANSNHTPLYSKVSSVLLGVVTEQDHWFLQVNDSNVTDVEEKLSSLTIQDGTQVSGLIDANRKAWGAVQETLCHVESGEVLNFCPKAPRYYYDVVSHYTLMNKYLASSQGIAIPVALRMEALTKRCWVINETLRKKSEDEGELLHTSVILCLNILLECIRKLRMEVEAILE
ncbi:hypothetical protein EN45_087190 [Penicillium chrysogenum]|uniref:Uncharacterized protein n=1 Tax=Penicillium chrysogenum TaxID=5076 RepID=A0A167QBY8_PENCH|nr:hypothetical protein EN45_087190 [Penicillium chrysogenum]